MAEERKGGRIRKFFIFAVLAGVAGAVVSRIRRQRSEEMGDVEWQELPPPEPT